MKNPNIKISWGELFDKVTILQIKLDNLTSEKALKNVKNEHEQLFSIVCKALSENPNAQTLLEDLKKINKNLWDIEDQIREKERDKSFDQEFIELARSVYFTNDERSRIKRKINKFLESELIEEKSYNDY